MTCLPSHSLIYVVTCMRPSTRSSCYTCTVVLLSQVPAPTVFATPLNGGRRPLATEETPAHQQRAGLPVAAAAASAGSGGGSDFDEEDDGDREPRHADDEEMTEELDFGEISGEAERMAELLATPAPAAAPPGAGRASAASRQLPEGAGVMAMKAYDNPLAASPPAGEEPAMTRYRNPLAGSPPPVGGEPAGMKAYGNPLAAAEEVEEVPVRMAAATAAAIPAASGLPPSMRTYNNPLASSTSIDDTALPPGFGALAASTPVVGGRGGGGGCGGSGGGGIQGTLDFVSSPSSMGGSSSDDSNAGGRQQYGAADDDNDDDGGGGALSDSSAELEVFRPPPPRPPPQQLGTAAAAEKVPLAAGAATIVPNGKAGSPLQTGSAAVSGLGSYRVTVTTGTKVGAGTEQDVQLTLVGSLGSFQQVLTNSSSGGGGWGGGRFQRGQVDEFTLEAGHDLGDMTAIQVCGEQYKSVRRGWGSAGEWGRAAHRCGVFPGAWIPCFP